jgi:ribosomal protein S30
VRNIAVEHTDGLVQSKQTKKESDKARSRKFYEQKICKIEVLGK